MTFRNTSSLAYLLLLTLPQFEKGNVAAGILEARPSDISDVNMSSRIDTVVAVAPRRTPDVISPVSFHKEAVLAHPFTVSLVQKSQVAYYDHGFQSIHKPLSRFRFF